MAKVVETADGKIMLKLSVLEKIFSLHGDIQSKQSNLIEVARFENPWSKEVLRGLRAPGTGFPYLIMLGTLRFRKGKDFAVIYKKRPVKIYEFENEPFKRWIVTISD